MLISGCSVVVMQDLDTMSLRSLGCIIFSSRFLKIENREQSLRYIAEMEQASKIIF